MPIIRFFALIHVFRHLGIRSHQIERWLKMDKDKLKKEIGNALRTQRKELNLKLEYVAQKMEVDVPTVSRWENGTRMPDMWRLMDLCKIYNCTIILSKDNIVIGNPSGEISTFSPKILSCINELFNAYDEDFQSGNKKPQR